MSEFDPSLSEVELIQSHFDGENDSAGVRFGDPVLHISWHLNRLITKITDVYEMADHPGESLDFSKVDDEVIPDLIVLSAMLARARQVSLPEAYYQRLHALEKRNGTPGSAGRAIDSVE